MAQELEKGDEVRCKSHGGEAVGTVRASKDEPQYLVRSQTSRGIAVHEPDALEKLEG